MKSDSAKGYVAKIATAIIESARNKDKSVTTIETKPMFESEFLSFGNPEKLVKMRYTITVDIYE